MWQNCICVIVLFVLVDNITQAVKKVEIEGYFWRDYAGFIPHDAFPGGNEKGSITYIGQVLYNDLLVPAKIVQSEEKAYFEWGYKEYSTEENIKILCTNDPDKLKWQSSSNYDFKNQKKLRLIIGGYEPNSKLYIGRVTQKGDVLLGKLLVNDKAILHTSKNGKSVESETFEVLYYDDPSSDINASVGAYYWRDFAGTVPADALPGGTEGQKPTYIAQVLYKSLLVPGKILTTDRSAHFEWGLEAHVAHEDIKIFCTDKPDNFKWLSTRSEDFKQIENKNFVVASHENDDVLYIGRMTVGSDIVVGKLLVNQYVYLHAVHKGKAVRSQEFEVLFYDPPATPSLDSRVKPIL